MNSGKVNTFNDRISNKLDQWIYFLKNSAVQADFQAQGIQEANKRFSAISLDPKSKKAFDRYMESLSSEASISETYFLDGKEEGLIEGREAGFAEGIEKGKEAGLAEGIEKGKRAGKLEAQQILIQNLRKAGFTASQIAMATEELKT